MAIEEERQSNAWFTKNIGDLGLNPVIEDVILEILGIPGERLEVLAVSAILSLSRKAILSELGKYQECELPVEIGADGKLHRVTKKGLLDELVGSLEVRGLCLQ